MKKKIKITMGFLIVLTGVIFFFSGKNNSIFWEEGARLSYGFKMNSVVEARTVGGRILHKVFTLRGTMNLRILHVSDEKIKAAVQFSPVTIKFGRQRQKAVEDIYSSIFFVEMSPDGRFTGFSFSNMIAPDDEESVKNTMRAMQVVVKKGLFSKWTSVEEDSNGIYKAAYSDGDGMLTKEKKAYVTLSPDLTEDGSPARVEVKRSRYTAEYGNGKTWLASLKGDELLVFYTGGNIFLKTSSYISLSPLSPDERGPTAIWNEGLDSEMIEEHWRRGVKNTISVSRRSRRYNLLKNYNSKSVSSFCTDLFKRSPKFNSSVIKEIMNYLKAFPEAAADLPDYIATADISENQQAMIIHALGKVGSEQAQKALVEIIQGSDMRQSNRMQAAMAITIMESPSENTVDSLWDVYSSRDNADRKTYDLSSTAVLSLGTISAKLKSSENKSKKERADKIAERIESDLTSEEDTESRIALIHAAGNTGEVSFVKPISKYLESGIPSERSAAVYSLAHIDSGDVDILLSEDLKNEKDVNVRGALVSALYNRKPTEEAVNTVLSEIKSEGNDIVRGKMYRYLLKNRDRESVRDTLMELKKTETHVLNRKLINRALYTGLKKKQ